MLTYERFLYAATAAAALALFSGCAADDVPAANPDEGRTMTLQLNVGARAVDQSDGTPTTDEAALHTLRVYAFTGGEQVGYYFYDASSATAAANNHTFYMDLKMLSTTTQAVDFYVVANEAAMQGVGSFTETTTEAQLNTYYFTGINAAAGLPMYYKGTTQLDVATDANPQPDVAGHENHTVLDQKVSLELERPFGKLGVFVAKTAADGGDLHITGLSILKGGPRFINYLMPQSRETLSGVVGIDQDYTLTPVADAVTAVMDADASADVRQDAANYTPVLAEPFYPFENPFGSLSWDVKGDDGGNVLRIDYKFDDEAEARSGLVYLPAIGRNNYYQVMCLMFNSGKMLVEYQVADWNDGGNYELQFDYPSYINPLMPLNGSEPADAPVMYYNVDQETTAGTFRANFTITGPTGQLWTPTLYSVDGSDVSDYEVTVWKNGVRCEAAEMVADASGTPYEIRVRPLNSGNVDKSVALAVSYTPSWEAAGAASLLLINGQQGNIAWPDSGDDPQRIVIKQVDNTINP